MDPILALTVAVSGYLVGSISFARIVALLVAPGTDVTRHVEPIPNTDLVYEDDAASATLVNLNLGARYGCLTSILDMLKVVLPMLALRVWFPETRYGLIFAATALVGHDWPLYHRFHGGRGESVIYGSILVIDPIGAVACNLWATVLGVLVGQVHLVRWGGMVLLIPWLWLRTGEVAILAYILFANAAFWISMRKDVRQFYEFQKVVIVTIVVMVAIRGFVQEYRAEQAMAILKKRAVPAVRVRRKGRIQEIPAGRVVPDGVVLLAAAQIFLPTSGLWRQQTRACRWCRCLVLTSGSASGSVP